MKPFMQQNKRIFSVVVMLSLFSAIGLIIWFGILPFQHYLTDKADSIQEYYATRENRDRQINKLPELEEQFASIMKDEGSLDILLSENEIVDFVKILERLALATDTHISIEAKSAQAIEERKEGKVPAKKGVASQDEDVPSNKKKTLPTILESVPYDRFLHVNIIVIGEYQNIVSFLHKMETLPLGLDVIGMDVKVRDNEDIAKNPAGPGSNPFLILGESTPVTDESAPDQKDEEPAIVGSLEAKFDTVVYVSKP
jgi:hypothetical protein